MTGIMVLGHGHFASGIASAAELILGKQDDFVWVDFPEGDTKTESNVTLHQRLDQHCKIRSIYNFDPTILHTFRHDRIKR